MLLFMFQKFRLIKERKQLELEQIKDFSVVNRIKKNEQNVQKTYTSIFAQLDKQAKNYISMAQNTINANAGIGVGMSNPMDYSGMNSFVYKMMHDAFANEKGVMVGKDENGEPIYKNLDSTTFDKMYAEYTRNNGSFSKNDDGSYVQGKDNIDLFNMVKQGAIIAQQNAQQNAGWILQQVTNNINNWLDSSKQMYEEEQNAALDALAYEQTMYDLDKTHREQRLAEIDAEIKNYDSKLQEKAQEMAPKFGLG